MQAQLNFHMDKGLDYPFNSFLDPFNYQCSLIISRYLGLEFFFGLEGLVFSIIFAFFIIYTLFFALNHLIFFFYFHANVCPSAHVSFQLLTRNFFFFF